MVDFGLAICSALEELTMLVNPVQSLAHLPDAFAFLALFDVGPSAVLLALVPLADVLATIRPLESSAAVFLVVHVLTNIATPVGPSESARAFHLVVDPLAVVDSAISPDVSAVAVDVVLEELSIVGALVRPNEFTATVLHAFLEFSLVNASVFPFVDSFAIGLAEGVVASVDITVCENVRSFIVL